MKSCCFLSLALTLCCLFTACKPETIELGTAVAEQFYLIHKGAQMPVVVEGNTQSQTFILVVHGGPGGNAMIYNEALAIFSEPLERDYAMVYWDQRGSGNARGSYSKDLLTVDQYVEDLDVLVDLLMDRYGAESRIFLMGHSWGGIVGTAYLLKEEREAKIAGWIEVDGAHDFPLINATAPGLLVDMGRQQIVKDNQVEAWEEIIEYCQDLPSKLDDAQALQVNRYANSVETYLPEAGVTRLASVEIGDILNFYFASPHNFVTATSNLRQTSSFLGKEILQYSLTDRLSEIELPCLFLWGRYDFVVPPILGEEAFEKVSTPEADKYLLIFGNSGHSPMAQEPGLFSQAVGDFVQKYR